MLTFKQFLNEDDDRIHPGYEKKSRNVPIDASSAIKWMEQNSKKYLARGNYIWRGVNSGGEIMYGTTKGQEPRRSRNTANFYTLWMDNHPDFEGFPKRSLSYICSTDEEYAGAFGALHLVVPSDMSEVGLCNSSDIWGITVTPQLNLKSFNSVTIHACDAANINNADKDWETLVESFRQITPEIIKEKLKSGTAANEIFLMDLDELFDETAGADNLYELWETVFAPRRLQLDLKRARGMLGDDYGEVWIQDDCIFIPMDNKQLGQDEQAAIREFVEDYPKLHAKIDEHWGDYEDKDPDSADVSAEDTLTHDEEEDGKQR